jgi:CBS domain-containing protein
MHREHGNGTNGASDKTTVTLHLGDVMVAPEPRIPLAMSIRVAWAFFLERGLTSLPVLDEDGHPVGTLFRTDLATAVFEDEPTRRGEEDVTPAEVRTATTPSDSLTAVARDDDDGRYATVASVMRPIVTSLPATASLEEAALVLQATAAPEIIVVDELGTMLGAVSADELADHLPEGPRPRRDRPRRFATWSGRLGHRR